MAITVGMVSLGCAKNRVDGEMMMATLKNEGFCLVNDAALADVAIVNTCGFIDDAKQESIDEILELAKLKQEGQIRAIVVTGCMAERYREEIRKELPEADAVIGIGANTEIADIIRQTLGGQNPESFPPKNRLPLYGERVHSTPSYYSYIKVAEGCDSRCAYCAIPMIRGRYRSRPMESIVEEAKGLAADGTKELILIAQDTSRYGEDLYGRLMLPALLDQLCEIDGLRWIRLLYCYPDYITDELLDTMARQKKVVKYIDLPLQHVSGRMLKSMYRGGDRQSITALLHKIRGRVPGITLRTTLITGFPGETEEDFTELSEFVKEIRFHRMGCFAYSREEGTAAAKMPNQIDEEVKLHRRDLLMEQQMRIMEEQCQKEIGETITVLTEGYDRYAECWFGRSEQDAPEIDGKVFFFAKDQKPYPGQFARVKITNFIECDLIGEVEELL